MRDAKKYGLSDFQWMAVVVSTILGTGIMSLPRTVGVLAGRDGWLSIVIGGLLTGLAATFVWFLCRRFPTRILPEYSILILGKPLGILVSLIYAAYALSLGATALRIFAELGKTWSMIWTPMPVFLIGVLLPVVYISRLGAVSLGRLMEIVMYLTGLALLLFLLPVREFDLLNLRPVGAEGWRAIVSAVPESSFAYLGFEVMVIFFPFIINRHKVLRVTYLALAVVTMLYAGNLILIYGVMGIEHSVNQVWPLINYLRIGALPIVQRVDNLVLFVWTAQVMAVAAIQYYAGTFTVATLTRHHYHDIWAITLWPLVYGLAIYPDNLVQVFALSDFVGRWGIIGILGITGLLLLVAKIRGLDESREEK